jgi:hypothetical protein
MPRCADRWRARVDVPVVIGLTLVVLGLAWYFRAVLVTSDPWHYAQAA